MTSTNLGLTDPTVGASTDAWGGLLNADMDLIDAFAGNIAAGVISGLTLSTAGSSANFACAAGLSGSADGFLMILASAITKSTSSWVVGTGNGGLDTGAIANNTWYHAWLIKRSDTGVVDVLVSLSPTAPTMPTNYNRKRRIGAMKTNGSAQWTKFVQVGDMFTWDLAATTDFSFAPTGSIAAKVVNVPTGVLVIAKLRGWCQTGASENTIFLVLSPSEASVTSVNLSNAYATCLINAGAGPVANQQGFAVDVLTDTSAQVNVIGAGTSGSSIMRGQAYGWIDPRGKW